MLYQIDKPNENNAAKIRKHKSSHVDCVEVTPEEQTALCQVAEELSVIDPISEADRFIMEAQELSAMVPRRIRRALLHFRRYGSSSGGFLIRGVPIGFVPPTPLTADHSIGASLQGARVMAILLAVLGDQFGFLAELAGQIFQNISPVLGFEMSQQSISSLFELLMHGETVFTMNRADYVMLLCLRADHEAVAGTTLSSAHTILSKLTSAETEILRQPIFGTTVDASFLRGAGIEDSILIGPIAVLDGSVLRPRFRCDFAETRVLDPENAAAVRALKRLWDVVIESAIELKLVAGDLLIIDNHEAFHGRTAFTPRYDGRDRWLLRSFVAKDLSHSEPDRPGDGRIVDRDYTTGPDVFWRGKFIA